MTRVLAEYGADVLKITGPNLSDVPFFQVDGNMGKRAADLDLKSEPDRRRFEELLADADVVVDGYRPGAIEKLGYGPDALAALAEKRGKGIVYVNENCFGYDGEWADRAGWQQIADCVCGNLLFVISCSFVQHIPFPKLDTFVLIFEPHRSPESPGPKENSWASTNLSSLRSPSPTTAPVAWEPSQH